MIFDKTLLPQTPRDSYLDSSEVSANGGKRQGSCPYRGRNLAQPPLARRLLWVRQWNITEARGVPPAPTATINAEGKARQTLGSPAVAARSILGTAVDTCPTAIDDP